MPSRESCPVERVAQWREVPSRDRPPVLEGMFYCNPKPQQQQRNYLLTVSTVRRDYRGAINNHLRLYGLKITGFFWKNKSKLKILAHLKDLNVQCNVLMFVSNLLEDTIFEIGVKEWLADWLTEWVTEWLTDKLSSVTLSCMCLRVN